MCAVGCIIPDRYYTDSMEGCAVNHLYYEFPQLFPYWKRRFHVPAAEMDNLMDLLDKLQVVHDQSDPLNWRSRLNDVAREYNLQP